MMLSPSAIVLQFSKPYITTQQEKDAACAACPINLTCMMQLWPREHYYCTGCQGWWLVDEHLIVRCDGHYLSDIELLEGPLSPSKRRAMLGNEVAERSVGSCPACTQIPMCTWELEDGSVVQVLKGGVLEIEGYQVRR